jgi:hypothetical protein
VFAAKQPPSVTFIVPVTTGGHHPFPTEKRHRSPMVAPASARTKPDPASNDTIRFKREKSTTGPDGLVLTAPYD